MAYAFWIAGTRGNLAACGGLLRHEASATHGTLYIIRQSEERGVCGKDMRGSRECFIYLCVTGDTMLTARFTAYIYTVLYGGNGATQGATVGSKHVYA